MTAPRGNGEPPASNTGRLLTSHERWGWEFRDPRPVLENYTEEPPVPAIAVPSWSSKAATKAEKSKQRERRYAIPSAMALAATSALWVFATPVAAAATGVVGVGLGWQAMGNRRKLRRKSAAAQREWLAQCIGQQQRFHQEFADWSSRKAQHEDDQQAKAEQQPNWVPLRPTTLQRVDVCGGMPAGWSSLLTAAIGSHLGSGSQVTVLDLSQDRVTDDAVAMARQHNIGTDVLVLPEQADETSLLAGLTPEEASSVLAEAFHASEKEQSLEARGVDADILRQVCQTLSGQLTFARLHEAFRVLLRRESRPSNVDESVLTVAEYRALNDLFGEGMRRSAEQRLFRLTSSLQRLAALGETDQGRPILHAPNAMLRVLQVSDCDSDITTELLRQILFQISLHHVRAHSGDDVQRVIYVVGADALRRAHVERLDQLARRRNIRLVLMFKHLREDAVDLLGGGEAAIFMKLGNAKEAEQAANFIGKDHRFVASNFTVSHGDSTSFSLSRNVNYSDSYNESKSWGTNSSTSHTIKAGMLFSFPLRDRNVSKGDNEGFTTGTSYSRSDGVSDSIQTGVNTSESVAYQRNYDYTVTPKFLQELSPTAFVLVDPADPGTPRLGDCDQAILDQPKVVDGPMLPAEQTGRIIERQAGPGFTGTPDPALWLPQNR